MKYCTYCKVLNEEKAKVCKICGRQLEPSTIQSVNKQTKNRYKSNKKIKTKTKYKTRNKIKYKTKDKREKGKMNLFQKILMLFLIVLVFALIGVIGFLGYHIYQTENIDVPNVIGYSYEEAYTILTNKHLNVEKIEKKVETEKEVGIVLNQNKRNKAKENQIIKLTVGVLDDKIIVPSIEGMTIENATIELNKTKIKYQIKYEKGSEDGKVINQSVKKGKKISPNETLIITVTKKEKEEKIEENKEEKETKETEIEIG